MHLGLWQQVLNDLLGPAWGRFAYTLIDSQSVGRRLIDKVRSALPNLPLTEYPERTQGIGYYRSAAFKIMAHADGDEFEIGDDGFVGWTAELIPNAKERCLISCVGLDRLAGLVHRT
jgi:hypothetical protein